MSEITQAGPSSSPLRVSMKRDINLTRQAAATLPEQDLIAIYSSVVQGVRTEASLLRHLSSSADTIDCSAILLRGRLFGFKGLLDHPSRKRYVSGQMGFGSDHSFRQQAHQRYVETSYFLSSDEI